MCFVLSIFSSSASLCHSLGSRPDLFHEKINSSWEDKGEKDADRFRWSKSKTNIHVPRQPCPGFTFTKTVSVSISENPQVSIVLDVSWHRFMYLIGYLFGLELLKSTMTDNLHVDYRTIFWQVTWPCHCMLHSLMKPYSQTLITCQKRMNRNCHSLNWHLTVLKSSKSQQTSYEQRGKSWAALCNILGASC